MDCIDEKITKDIVAVLQTITVANGYNYDIGVRVERLRGSGNDPSPFPLTLLLENEPDPNNEHSSIRADELNYMIWFFDGRDDSDPDSTPAAERFANVKADISKALMEDPERNDLAEYTSINTGNLGYTEIGPGYFVYVTVGRTLDTRNPYEKA